jgi:hypothetical protein
MSGVDIFTNVHKGIRKALFESCLVLGATAAGDARESSARRMLRETLHFVAHHGENEDLLLLPQLRAHAAEVHAAMSAGHARVNAELAALLSRVDGAPLASLYQETAAFTALYLEHMHEEEMELESRIREALPLEQLQAFSREAVARTAPADQRAMLSWMLPAMPRAEAEALLARLPGALAAELRNSVSLGP